MIDVALVTCAKHPDLTEDDRILKKALEDHGVTAHAIVWDDAGVDWSDVGLTIVRSTWDYHRRVGEFHAWLQHVSVRSRFANGIEALRWNLDKGYLLDLAAKGVPIVPTVLLRADTWRGTVREAPAHFARGPIVMKPAIGSSSYNVRSFEHLSPSAEEHAVALFADGDVLLQPFYPQIYEGAERAIVVVSGEICGAFVKPPFGRGTRGPDGRYMRVRHEPTAEEIVLVEQCVATLPEAPLYARVDVLSTPSGPLLMELELLEPMLYFGELDRALSRFVDACVRLLCLETRQDGNRGLVGAKKTPAST